MRVAIFDMHHFEVALTALRLFSGGGNEVLMCVDRRLHELFQNAIPEEMTQHQWLVHENEGEEKAYLDRVRDTLLAQRISLFWITSIDNNFRHCAKVVAEVRQHSVKTVMTVHNLNHWFSRRVPFRPAALKAYVARKLLLHKVAGICVLDDGLAETLREGFHYNKPIIAIPGVALTQPSSPERAASAIFVVPGGIEEKRRDYELILDGFETAAAISPEAELILLGRPIDDYGERVVERCRSLCEAGLKIRTFGSFVPQGLFQELMLRAHVILAPVRTETTFSGGLETYGRTKSTGAIGDAIRYSRAAMVPSEMKVSDELRGHLIPYSSREEFKELLCRLSTDIDFLDQCVSNALISAERFAPSLVFQRCRGAFESFLE